MWVQILYLGWTCVLSGVLCQFTSNANAMQIEVVPVDAIEGEAETHASNAEPLRLAKKYGVQLQNPYHQNCYLGCDGEQLYYWFFNKSRITSENGEFDEEFLIQRVKSTGKTAFSASVPNHMFTVEAVKLDNAQSAIPDRHWGEVSVRVPAKFQTEFEIGTGSVPTILSGKKWPFSTRGKILSCSSHQTEFDQVHFTTVYNWVMNLEIDSSRLGTFHFSVPDAKIEISGNIADLTTRSGFGKIVPEKGVGTLLLDVSSIIDVRRILGTPSRTEEWIKLNKRGLFFPNGMMTIIDTETLVLTTIGLSPPFLGSTKEGVRLGSKIEKAESALGPLVKDGDSMRSRGISLYCSQNGFVESILLTSAGLGGPMQPISTEVIYKAENLKNILP